MSEDMSDYYNDNPFRKDYTINKVGNSITLSPENEEEEQLLEEVEKTIKNKITRMRNEGKNVNYVSDKEEEKYTLKFCFDKYYKIQEKEQSDNYLKKVRQVRGLLYMYFGENKNIKSIKPRDAWEFVDFMKKMPKNIVHIKELKDKDIKTLILKDSKILDKYEKVGFSTIDEHIKKARAFYTYLVNLQYVYFNVFSNITKQATKKSRAETDWKPFKLLDLKNLLLSNENQDKYREEYNTMVFDTFTGFRREEIALLKVKHINFEKSYIDFDFDILQTKTENSKRIVPIHKKLVPLLEEQLSGKEDEDFLFFNKKDWKEENRGARIGDYVNKRILEYFDFDKKVKKQYVFHSFRKNFAQKIAITDNIFTETEYKSILGHSTNSDITDKHYLQGKRDWDILKKKMDRIDFSDIVIYKPKIKLSNVSIMNDIDQDLNLNLP